MIPGKAGRPPEAEDPPRLVKHSAEVTSVTVPSIEESLKRLIPSAKALSEASDMLSVHIAFIEERLKRLNVGLACWVKVGEHGSVGYYRFSDGWHLAYKTEEDQIQPLVRSPRYFRWRGIHALPQLIDSLVYATDSMRVRMKTASEDAIQILVQMDAVIPPQKETP